MRRLTDRAGGAAVEFAILLPVFVLIIFGVIELALMEWTHAALQHATEMAARCAAVNTVTCNNAANIEAYAATQAYGLTLKSSTCSGANCFTYSNANCKNQVSVTSPGYAFNFTVPLYGKVTVNINASSCNF